MLGKSRFTLNVGCIDNNRRWSTNFVRDSRGRLPRLGSLMAKPVGHEIGFWHQALAKTAQKACSRCASTAINGFQIGAAVSGPKALRAVKRGLVEAFVELATPQIEDQGRFCKACGRRWGGCSSAPRNVCLRGILVSRCFGSGGAWF